MLKITVAVLALALAGSASAAGWRNLRIDATSLASFEQSVATFQDKLSPSRRIAFAYSLEDIKIQGARLAAERQREYTDADFLQQVHGLGYEQIVTLTDPTGKTETRYRAQYYYSRAGGGGVSDGSGLSWSQSYRSPWSEIYPDQNGTYRGEGAPNTADNRAACSCLDPANAPTPLPQ